MRGEHDYVIVGAGSAGCVLANRLSADSTAALFSSRRIDLAGESLFHGSGGPLSVTGWESTDGLLERPRGGGCGAAGAGGWRGCVWWMRR